jgi:hypothetical protein
VTSFDTVVIAAVQRKIARLEAEVHEERKNERQAIEDACAGRGSVPPNYWQPRFHAEQRLVSARALLALLKE